MPILPDLGSLAEAAAAVTLVADEVESCAARVQQQVEAVPWRGPRREAVVTGLVWRAGAASRGQAAAQRELATELRLLVLEVQQRLQLLADLARRAREHLEDLLRLAQAIVDEARRAVASAAAGVAGVVDDLLRLDLADAVREARGVAERALDRLGSIRLRLTSLPEPHDPVWERLGPEILRWVP